MGSSVLFPAIAVLAIALIGLAVPLAALHLLRAPSQRLTHTAAQLMAVMASTLTLFLVSEDRYTADGRTVWTMYDVEYLAVPTILVLFAAGFWLMRSKNERRAGGVAALLAAAAGVAAFLCLGQTLN